jgi:dsRNA-specific ribonuclease
VTEEPKPEPSCPKYVYRPKVLADTIEAIIGAAFCAGGLQTAVSVARKLKLDVKDRWHLDPDMVVHVRK